MMKLAIFALVALSSVALAAKLNIYEQEGHFYHHGKRLGVFADAPFLDLYKTYSHAFVVPNIIPKPSDDDVRYYRPSADVCHNFFTNFVNMGHKISDFDQFVVLDACLGYVLENVYSEEVADKTAKISEDFISDFDGLRKSPEIYTLYETKMRDFTNKERTCVADLMMHTIKFKNQFRGVKCNNQMVQAYVQFAECQSQENFENLTPENTQDPYVKMVYELLKERATVCFEQEAAHIENAVRDRFYKTQTVVSKFSWGDSLRKQRNEYKWPKEVATLLSAVQDSKVINLRQVHQIISFYVRGDDVMEEKFLKHLAKYATQEIVPHRQGKITKKSPEFTDENGTRRYTDLMDKLCNPFRVSTSERHFSYALSIIRLVQLLHYPKLFHISEDAFLKKIVKQSKETAPVYLATQSCNLITYTQGSYDNTKAGSPQYVVSFKPDNSKMVVWPLVDFL